MNKKGSLQAIFTARMVMAIMLFIVFIVFMSGGGFKTTFDLGNLVSQIPIWFWLVVALLWLASQFRK